MRCRWKAKRRQVMASSSAPAAELEPEHAAYFDKCREKLGFVPNVLQAYAFDNAKLRAFILMADDLMLGDSGLSKLEREMIAVAVSAVNHCHYCLTSHGAAVRQRAKRPGIGRADRAELPRRRSAAAAKGDARLCRPAHRGARQDRGRRTGKRCARRASAIATSGTSPPWPPSTTCQTAWPRPPTCGPTGTITIWRASSARRRPACREGRTAAVRPGGAPEPAAPDGGAAAAREC